MLSSTIQFCLRQKLVVLLLVSFFVGWGVRVAPFDWDVKWMPRDPVAVDAIPDLGDNQQIIFTEWPGRSPKDVDDQITYPLTVNLQGVPGVKEVRSYSYFGFSSVYLVFDESTEFYWSRSRILEKLNSLPAGTLPEGVTPSLGPDATGLGQIFWYTLEGLDPDGNPVGGWDLDELRAIQDWQVRYVLQGAKGVSEVSSIGGFVREYQVDVDPDALRVHQVTLAQVANAVRASNNESGARNLAINGVEYIIRGLGYVKELKDLERAVIVSRHGTPVTVGDVATVSLGAAQRRGALDKNGAEVVGGVVVARFGENPLEVIKHAKENMHSLTSGLPERGVVRWEKTTPDEVAAFYRQELGLEKNANLAEKQKALTGYLKSTPRENWAPWVTLSKVSIVPFYDRTGLISETLGTLNQALYQQVLITVIVVVIMLMHLRSSALISVMLPLAVLVTFIAMKLFGVDANVVALAGIAIAIGTVVDIGIVLTENILKHLNEADESDSTLNVIHKAAVEVGGAVTTSVLTTVSSFLPVFLLTGANGRLYKPLAYTKTFALCASLIVALTIIPPLAHMLMKRRKGLGNKGGPKRLPWQAPSLRIALNLVIAMLVGWLLAGNWAPLGLGQTNLKNFVFVLFVIGGLLLCFALFQRLYPRLLGWCLDHKLAFLSLPAAMLCFAFFVWKGADRVLGGLPGGSALVESGFGKDLTKKFPGLKQENRPRLEEGSFLLMPTTSTHADIGEALDALKILDRQVASIPEVKLVVGKLGRAESALDPAPISMFENVIQYHPEYRQDKHGRAIRFKYDQSVQEFVRNEKGELIEDPSGIPYRQWREHIKSPDDIWREIEKVASVLGTTSAPKLQPIETRLVMLQTGMRAPMGLKIKGPDLKSIESFGIALESALKESKIEGLNNATVNADRIVGKPYLEVVPDREEAARYGLNVRDIHKTLQMAVGGHQVSSSVEGRERFAIRVRFQREKRNSIEALQKTLINTPSGAAIPLSAVASVRYVRGPQMIKSENTFLTGYLTFDKTSDATQIDVVNRVIREIDQMIADNRLTVPQGVTYKAAGSFEEKLEFDKNMKLIVPITLFVIFVLLYLQFRSAGVTLILLTGIAVACSGGFIMLWLYAQPGFLDFNLFGTNIGELFQVQEVALSTAVWVGFIALFGIATDDGVVISTYLTQTFASRDVTTKREVRDAVVEAGMRRVRPCLMTTATTLLALLPVLTSTGRGSDIMVPMAIPVFGGMTVELLTMFVVPTLYSFLKERKLKPDLSE